MHELSLMESLRDILEAEAVSQHFETVQVIELTMGPFSHVEAEALRFCFDSVMRGSLAEEAELRIHWQVAAARCPVCGHHCSPQTRYDPCPACGAFGLKIESGDELMISHLEVSP